MGLWFKVDADAMHSLRMRLLAGRMGDSVEVAFFKCCLAWALLYEREGGMLTRDDIDAAAGMAGFADLMVSVELAEEGPEGFRLKGSERAQGLAKYRATQSDRARAGVAKRKGKGLGEHTKHQPSAPAMAGADGSAIDHLFTLTGSSQIKKGSTGRVSKLVNPESVTVARYRLDAIRSHTPDYPDSHIRWANDVDLAMRRDGRTDGQLRSVVDYAHQDPRGSFWRANLLSGAALRKQCGRLLIALQERISAPRTAPDGTRLYSGVEMLDRARNELERERQVRERGEGEDE